jgi:multidrug efflux pump subunit AcrB
MKGITGQFFRQFGLTITIAVLISLFVAFTLDPMLSARLARPHVPGEARREGRLVSRLRRLFDAMDRGYERSLDLVLAHPWATLGAATLIFVGSLGVGSRLGSEFVPAEDRNQLVVNLELAPGTSLASTSEVSERLERKVREIPGVVAVYATLGPQEDVRLARWRVNLVDKSRRTETAEDVKRRVRAVLASEPALVTSAVSDPPTVEGLGDWPPVLMRVVGRDFDVLRSEARFLVETMRAIPALTDVQLKDSPGKPELQVAVDRQEAARAGVAAGAVALQVRLATQGEVAGKVRDGRREAEIRVRLAGEDRESARALERMWVQTPRGPMSLSQIATLRQGDGPSTIEHEMRERQISVWAQVAPGHDLGSATKELRARLAPHRLPSGYFYVWDGMQKEQEDSQANMGFALLVAVVFIFMVLASQFESLVHPFTIMLALPLAFVGAFLALAATGGSINMGSLIGLILLMGLVTKNAILLVDGALQHMRDDGEEAAVAVRKAGPRRLRPILMTSAAMVLGMLPTALGRGMGSEFRSPMAVAVIGGVVTSTMLTLWVVPVVFVRVERLRGWLRGRRRPPAPPARPEGRGGAVEEPAPEPEIAA